jgi:hypothetical protein
MAGFAIFGFMEARTHPNDRKTGTAIVALGIAFLITLFIAWGTTSPMFKGDVIPGAAFFTAVYGALFFGGRAVFNQHRGINASELTRSDGQPLKEWLEHEETEHGERFLIRQGAHRRISRFIFLVVAAFLSFVCILFGLTTGQDLFTVLGALGLLIFGLSATVGLFPFLAGFGAPSVVSIELEKNGLIIGDATTPISYSSITNIYVRNSTEESSASIARTDAQRTDRQIFIGGTGAVGASFAAASVAGSMAKGVGEIGGQSAILGIHIVRSKSDCSVWIGYTEGKAKVAEFLSSEEAQILASRLLEALQKTSRK